MNHNDALPPITSATQPIATPTAVYKAFISYSHSDNREQGRKWADWLHHSLESYEVPTELIGKPNQYGQAIPAQIYPIFQDEKELSANNDLSASLQTALNQSEFLIYLSSPRSARSVYVQEEIKHFKKLGKADKIIALIVAGEPEYGDTQTDNQCFPDALRYDVDSNGNILYDHHAEALAADVRIPETSEQGFTSSEGYRRHLQQLGTPSQDIKPLVDAYQERLNLAKLKIISTILGVPLRELTKRDKAYQLERAQRKTRIVQRIAAAIGGLAIIAGATGVYAWQQKNQAQQNFAQSLFTSGINKLAQNEYGDPAAYIAAAVRSGSQNATEFAESMLVIRDDMVLLPNFKISTTQYSPDGRFVAGFADMGADINVLQLYDTYTRQKLTDVFTYKKAVPAKPAFDGKGNLYFIHNDQLYRYSPDKKTRQVIYTAPVSVANPATTDSVSASATASSVKPTATTDNRQSFGINQVSPDGQWVALNLYSGGNKVLLVHTQNAQPPFSIELPPKSYRDVQFSDDSRLVWVTGTNNSTDANRTVGQVISLTPQPTLLTQVELPTSLLNSVIAPDNATIYVNGSKNFDQLLDIRTATLIPLDNATANARDFVFNPDGRTLVGFDTNGLSVFDRATGKLLSQQKFDPSKLKKVFKQRPMGYEQPSPDFNQQLAEMNKQVYLKNDIGNPLVTNEFQFDNQYQVITPAPDGKTLLLLAKDKQRIDKFDIESGRLTPNAITLPEAGRILQTIKPNYVVTRTDNKTLRIFDIAIGKPIGTSIATAGRNVQFNADNTQLLTRMGNESDVGIWQVSDGKLLKKFKLPSVSSNFRVDDNFKYIGIANDNNWQVLSIDEQKPVISGNEKIINGAFSLDGNWFAMGSTNNVMRVFNLQTGKQAFESPSISAPLMQFSPDSKTLVASVQNGRMRLWNMDTGKPFGQTIPVSPDTQLLHFSHDSAKLFIQDVLDSRVSPAVKIIDVKTGNLISLPFAQDSYSSVNLVNDNHQLITTKKTSDSAIATVWQMPTGFDIAPDDLANDLETFYQRKYDPDTGAIVSIKPAKQYKTWFFQDIYTRPIGPTSKATIPEVIERLLPVKDVPTAGLLASNYFYHPLARAGLAEYFSRNAETGGISQRLITITQQQLKRMTAEGTGNTSVRDKTQQLLNKANQQIDQQIRQALATPASQTAQASATTPVNASGVH